MLPSSSPKRGQPERASGGADPNKRTRSSKQGSRSNRRKNQSHEEDDDDEALVNLQILQSLQNLNTLVKSIDERLGRFERQQLPAETHMRRPGQRQTVAPTPTVTGTWRFMEGSGIRRKEGTTVSVDTYGCNGSFGQVDSEGVALVGGNFRGTSVGYSSQYRHPSKPSYSYSSGPDNYYTPLWSEKERFHLPQLLFNDKAELDQKSGIYSLAIKFNKASNDKIERAGGTLDAGIIIGEMEFDDKGYVMAEGADWDRLLSNQRQTRLPYSHNARGNPIWLRRKISEPWLDGDILKFRIDTNENTVVFQRGNTPEKTFWNVLAFSNNCKYPDFLRVFAYCGYFFQDWETPRQNPGIVSETTDFGLTIV